MVLRNTQLSTVVNWGLGVTVPPSHRDKQNTLAHTGTLRAQLPMVTWVELKQNRARLPHKVFVQFSPKSSTQWFSVSRKDQTLQSFPPEQKHRSPAAVHAGGERRGRRPFGRSGPRLWRPDAEKSRSAGGGFIQNCVCGGPRCLREEPRCWEQPVCGAGRERCSSLGHSPGQPAPWPALDQPGDRQKDQSDPSRKWTLTDIK